MKTNNLFGHRARLGIFLTAGLLSLSMGSGAFSQENVLRPAPLAPLQLAPAPTTEVVFPMVNARVSTSEMESKTTGKPGSPDSLDSLESPNSLSGTQALPDLTALLWQLGTSTAFVLCLCVGGLVVFKRFRLDERFSGSRRVASGTGPEIRIEAVLRLKGNRVFEIVRADNARLIVVSDSNGIQSVLPITTGFEEQLQSCDLEKVMADLELPPTTQQPKRRSIRNRPSLTQSE